MTVVEYMPHRDPGTRQLVAPYFIDDGGHFPAHDGSMVGILAVGCYAPDTLTVLLDAAALRGRLLAMHAQTPFIDRDGAALDQAAVEAIADAWWSERVLS